MLSETDKHEMRRNVADGVDFLDRKVPDWRQRIDETRLELQFCESCIVGQLESSGVDMGGVGYARSYGFALPYGLDDERADGWRYLDSLWIRAMRIGDPQKTHTVDPIREPAPAPEPRREPAPTPPAPKETPKKEPVPA